MKIEFELGKLDFENAKPIGETRYDEKAFKNLEDLIDMTDNALSIIMEIAGMKNYCHEGSIINCSEKADRFVRMWSEYINEYVLESEGR